MYLKRIELNGFKSFHNKKEIIVNEGITGVVGPNGSGKSNIADALRWVLGEQSSKNLRGATMQDVIFNGTQSRPKKGYCEVSLIFDNTDRKVDSEFTEICVTRKMYRSGESEYSINHAGCRLKDILELFRDTGIGKEGYSIIGQGRIDEILNSKATSRRRVFEEAAGIMKYRVRKEEAERNLQKTNDNILRLDDIIAELETQIGPLEEQMNQARDYLSLRDRLKSLEINLFLYNYEKTGERIARLEQQTAEQEQEQADTTAQIAALGEKTVALKGTLQEVQTEIDAHNSRVGELMREQERLKGALALIEEKENNFRAVLEENEKRYGEYEAAVQEQTAGLEKINEQVERLNEILDEKYALVTELRKRMEAMAGEADRVTDEIGELRRAAEEKRVRLQTLAVDDSENALKRDMLEKKALELAGRLETHQTETEQLAKQAKVCRQELGQCEERGAQVRQASNGLNSELQDVLARLAERSGEVRSLEQKLSEDRSRYKLISDMREEYEGYFDSVKSLFSHSKNEPAIKSKIHGVLAELIDVPREYELPIEVILGNALQNVVVDRDEDAKAIIEYLRKNNLGRITFLPAKSLKVRHLKEEERKWLDGDGVLCVASEAVGCDDAVRPAVDFLLARTVIVRDMESAIALMKKADYGFRTVTMQGDFIKPGGVITGGSIKQRNTGLLSRKRMAEELKTAVAAHEQALQQATLEAERDERAADAKKREQQALIEELRVIEIASAEAKQRLAASERQMEEKDQVRAAMRREAEECADELAALQVRAEETSAQRQTVQEEYSALEERLRQAEEKRTQGMKADNAERENLSAMEMEQAETANQKNMLLREAEHLRAAAAAAREGVDAIARQNETIKAERNAVRAEKTAYREQLDDLLVEVKNAGEMVRGQLEKRDEINAELEHNAARAEELAQHKNLLIEQKYKLVANREKAELSRETMQTKIWEDYGLTYANALEYKSGDFAYQNSVREIEEIREKIRGMGAVNPNAIEDYARVRERFDNLTVQRDDLLRAGADLKVVIDDLLTGMRESFREKFEKINRNFTRVFQELFGGGNAQLELLSDGDIMECGIEIIAEPPGKKLQSISLLSGGEKALAAIALLFAMLSINPSPVCLLDEIDAPLDDANVIRLAEYLTRLSKELQFIVITHRKPTMAVCNTLYGIAMHEKGVSDIVSVRLN